MQPDYTICGARLRCAICPQCERDVKLTTTTGNVIGTWCSLCNTHYWMEPAEGTYQLNRRPYGSGLTFIYRFPQKGQAR